MSELPEEDFIPADDFAGTDEAETADVVHFSWKVTKNLTRRIDQYLVDRVGYLSRAGVQRVIKEGLVTANGRVVKASYHPQDGDVIAMVAPPEPVNELVPEDIPLDIIYEDEHFLALNKQADLIVHPARGKWTGTLVNGLVHYAMKTGISFSNGGVRAGQLPDVGTKEVGNWRPGILHRLDRNTTGIMLIAKSEEAHWRIARQFENRTIQKTYMAICHGIPPLKSDIISAPIGKDKYIREKQAVRKLEAGGKEAVTIYEVQKTFGTTDSSQLTTYNSQLPLPCCLVKLTPKTGRTHQLRVHMTHLGHPMLGDTIYGGREIHLPPPVDFHFTRQALHAYQISFTHPGTLKPMTLQAPLPKDFTTLMAMLETT